MPRLGTSLNLRTQRKLRTLCVPLDFLARQKPAQAADLITQCVKALEKSTVDAHWGSAQFLELLNPEGAGLLERDEEFFTSREFLNNLKLKGYSQWRGPEKGEAKGDREKGGRVWALDAEDFKSCFNLFRLPLGWLKFMCFNKLVIAEAFGGPPGKQVYAAMCVLRWDGSRLWQ